MKNLFLDATAFNGDLSKWETHAVIDMHGTFKGASKFNKPIGNWDVSNVDDMAQMFNGAAKFNQELHDWNAEKVPGMYDMFTDATAFTKSLCGKQWLPVNKCTACPTDLKYDDDAALSSTQGWNVWSASCSLQNNIVVPLGKKLKLKKDTTNLGQLIVDRQGTSAAIGNHFDIKGALVLKEITLEGGYASNKAGSVYVDTKGSATFDTCQLSNNYAGQSGGAVYVDGGTAIFNQCTLKLNKADGVGAGGAVYVDKTNSDTASATFNACTLSKNSAPNGEGGAVYSSGTATFTGCTTVGNTASVDGPAFYVHSQAVGSLTLINPAITSQTDAIGGSNAGLKKIQVTHAVKSICNFKTIHSSRVSTAAASSPVDLTFDANTHIPLHIPTLEIPMQTRETVSTGDVPTLSFGLFFDGASNNLKNVNQNGANQKTTTVSFWIKGPYAIGETTIISFGSTGGGSTQSTFRIILDASRRIGVSSEINNAAVWGVFTDSNLAENPTKWSHVVLGIDTMQAVDVNRCKIWLNNVLQVHKTGGTYPTQNYASSPFGSTASGSVNRIGSGTGSAANGAQPYNYFKGWLAQVVRIDGRVLAPTAFAALSSSLAAADASSRQKYIETLNVGAKGFVLTFDVSTNLGKDSSNALTAATSDTKNDFASHGSAFTTPTTAAHNQQGPLRGGIQYIYTGDTSIDNPTQMVVIVDHGILNDKWQAGVQIHRSPILDKGCEAGCGRCDAVDHCIECNNGKFLSEDGKCHPQCMLGDNVIQPNVNSLAGGACLPCRMTTSSELPHAAVERVDLNTKRSFITPTTMTFSVRIHRNDVSIQRGQMTIQIRSGHALFHTTTDIPSLTASGMENSNCIITSISTTANTLTLLMDPIQSNLPCQFSKNQVLKFTLTHANCNSCLAPNPASDQHIRTVVQWTLTEGTTTESSSSCPTFWYQMKPTTQCKTQDGSSSHADTSSDMHGSFDAKIDLGCNPSNRDECDVSTVKYVASDGTVVISDKPRHHDGTGKLSNLFDGSKTTGEKYPANSYFWTSDTSGVVIIKITFPEPKRLTSIRYRSKFKRSHPHYNMASDVKVHIQDAFVGGPNGQHFSNIAVDGWRFKNNNHEHQPRNR